jgi:hypothetical protein
MGDYSNAMFKRLAAANKDTLNRDLDPDLFCHPQGGTLLDVNGETYGPGCTSSVNLCRLLTSTQLTVTMILSASTRPKVLICPSIRRTAQTLNDRLSSELALLLS